MNTADSIRIDIPKSVVTDIIMKRLDTLWAPQPVAGTTTTPEIGEAWNGGIYAGLTIFDDKPCALVLLPGDKESVNWKDAIAWAEKQDGYLPSRFDALTLFKNLKSEFKPEWYWTIEPSASYVSYAWMQNFNYGGQDYTSKDDGYRARAVRRYPLSNSVI